MPFYGIFLNGNDLVVTRLADAKGQRSIPGLLFSLDDSSVGLDNSSVVSSEMAGEIRS